MKDSSINESDVKNNNEVSQIVDNEVDQSLQQRCTCQRFKIIYLIAVLLIICLLITGFLRLHALFMTSKVIEPVKDSTSILRTLIISDNKDLWALEIDTEDLQLLQESENGIAAFDVLINDTIFWSECNSSLIKFYLNAHPALEYPKLWKTQALAMDYVTHILYLIDKSAGTLNVLDIHSKMYNVILSDLQNPHDIILDSYKGVMFILQQHHSIMKCNMDGKSRKNIIIDTEISAMSIDREDKMIYWSVDFVSIKRSNYDGTAQTSLISVSTSIVSLLYLQNQLFFISTRDCFNNCSLISELVSCEISENTRVNMKSHLFSQKPLKTIKTFVYHEPRRNPCKNNGGCQQICLLTAYHGFTCACHIGWQLNSDLKSCQITNASILYTQGNYIRRKILDTNETTFTENMIPRKFYVETLNNKSSITFIGDVRSNNVYISDDTNIYVLNLTSTEYSDQKKIFSVDKGFYIDHLEFDMINKDLYYIKINNLGKRWIEVITMRNKNLVSEKVTNEKEKVFLVGGSYALYYSGRWHKLLSFKAYRHYNMKQSVISDNTYLYFYDMYKLVAIDYEKSKKIYWIDRIEDTSIKYTKLDFTSDNFIYLNMVKNPKFIVIYDKWMYLGNLTSIWRFDKINGDEAFEVTTNFKGNQIQLISGGQIYYDFLNNLHN